MHIIIFPIGATAILSYSPLKVTILKDVKCLRICPIFEGAVHLTPADLFFFYSLWYDHNLQLSWATLYH